MIKEAQVKCDRCDGDGKIRREGIDSLVSSTAWTVEIVTCPRCKGQGKLKEFVETNKWRETLDGEKVRE